MKRYEVRRVFESLGIPDNTTHVMLGNELDYKPKDVFFRYELQRYNQCNEERLQPVYELYSYHNGCWTKETHWRNVKGNELISVKDYLKIKGIKV